MVDATARYVLQADDRTKAAIESVKKNFRELHRDATGAIRAVNLALTGLAGFGALQLVRKSLAEAAAKNQEFAETLAGVKRAASDLLVPSSGLPAVTDSMRELKAQLEDPATKAAADALFSTLIRGTAGAVSGLAAVIGKVRDIGTAGAGSDEVERLQASLRIQRGLLTDDLAEGPRKRMEAAIARNEERLQQLTGDLDVMRFDVSMYSRGFKPDAGLLPKLNIPQLTTAERDAADAARKAAEDAKNKALGRDFSFNSDLTRKTADAMKESIGGVLDEWQNTQDKVEQNWLDLADQARNASNAMSVYAEQAARNMQDAFAQFLFDPFQGGVRGMLTSFINAVRQMVAQIAAAKLFESATKKGGWLSTILGSLTGASGGFSTGEIIGDSAAIDSGGFFKVLAGKRAEGGPVDAGRPYLVGERGPELFVPRMSGGIIPNGANGGGARVTYSPTFNLVNPTQESLPFIMREIRASEARTKADIIEGIRTRKYPV